MGQERFVATLAEKAEREEEAAAKAAAKKAAKKAKAKAERVHYDRDVAVDPTPVPVPTDAMPGMSKANAALYVLAATGGLPFWQQCNPDGYCYGRAGDPADGGGKPFWFQQSPDKAPQTAPKENPP